MSARIVVRHSAIHGSGVFAAADIPARTELLHYGGRVITHREADEAEGGDFDSGHTFLFTLNDEYVIEGGIDGNEARWINHSCEPNCEAVLVEAADGNRAHDRIVIETIRAVRAGEELTYDYGITTDEPLTAELKALWACRCGAAGCSGLILKPETAEAPAQQGP